MPDGFDQTLDAWFDVTAFAPTVGRTYGNCANNTVRGPGSKSMNMSLFRSIELGGDKRLELRVETFNLFNWVNYGFPAANVVNPATFGTHHHARSAIRARCSWRSSSISSG